MSEPRKILPDGDPATTAWLDGLMAWREQRAAGLIGPHGWWSITCLEWLEEGENTIGSAEGSAVGLAERFPTEVARVNVAGERATLIPATGASLLLGGEPFTGQLTVEGDVAFVADDLPPSSPRAATAGQRPARISVVRRGDLWGVRVHDPVAAERKSAERDLAWFDPAPAWVIEAEFLPPETDEEVPVSNVIGQVSMHRVAGRARFVHEGTSWTLLATEAGAGRLFFNFRDASNEDLDAVEEAASGEGIAVAGLRGDHVRREGLASYSGGRFLTTDAPVAGRVTLDFNRANHPPCAHTPYATCPMPTPGNRLPFAVMAGERLARG
jgi:uncharacterized protein (DUF1684 family)